MLMLAQVASPSPAVSDEVIVIGHRAEKELAACLARNCPPAEEVEASLQASVEQFADGRYDDARGTLKKAIGRNRNHAAELPGPVSRLYATLATVAEHQGDEDLWRTSARNNLLVLRRHLGDADSATLREELRFADSMIGLGSPDMADRTYKAVQLLATKAGHSNIAAVAAFRRAWLAMIRTRFSAAERFADEAVLLSGTDDRLMTELREILRTRIAIHKGDSGAVDALAARLRRSATARPQLLFAPALVDVNPTTAGNLMQSDPWHDARIRFADVGYWIRPDGRTAEVKVLRTSGLGQWFPGIIRQVSKRRYAPLDVEPGNPGLYRIDRFTVRATTGVSTSSRIIQRTGNLTIHIIDLTETDAMSAEHVRRTQEGFTGQGV